ncbi:MULTISPECIES: hypothetical protein [Marinobacter]|uniref:Uncharacterized protein n=1 Tax=Marinobacter xiaoshiensis TaxID=3073652 RepID=A0ABU2HCM1_9GAMM|nr:MULTISPECIES: hypothetical protein [unclassified Marinobacter]MBK1887261.1 hypothetical protein [Marinobacter sp. DY40_1A1]MDS1308830.1 hypothetical protein [Marinobacter sp. F60267]
MPRIGLIIAFLLLLPGCAPHSSLIIQPSNELSIEVPSDMFSSVKVRDGELLFLKNNRIIGFVKSDEIPNTASSDTASDASIALFESAAQGSSKPAWIESIPDAQAFGVVQGDFRTIFIVPDGSAQSLITFQGPTEGSDSVRINGVKLFE